MKPYDPAFISFLLRSKPTEALRDPDLAKRFQYAPLEVATPLSFIKELIANELAGRARA